MVKTENLNTQNMHAQFSLFLWFKQKNKNTEQIILFFASYYLQNDFWKMLRHCAVLGHLFDDKHSS